ncbi:MAG TPA: hypothetical protein VKP68_12105 [Ramlibacter sp.]|nr:hypothetical protein [Ramlibacter sp.]
MPRTNTTNPDVTRNKLVLAIASALAVGLLAAFWMLCSQQVRKAQERDATARVQRIAVAQCLSDVPGATLSSCAARFASLDRDVAPVAVAAEAVLVNFAAPAPMSGKVPVNYVYR